jgi:hypothetical protein
LALQGIVQYNAERNGSITVSDVCKILTASNGSAYDRYVELNRKVSEGPTEESVFKPAAAL